jgi:hypothetical protein
MKGAAMRRLIAVVVLLLAGCVDSEALSARIDGLEARADALEQRAAVTVRLTPEYMAVETEGGIIVVPAPAEGGGGMVDDGIAGRR